MSLKKITSIVMLWSMVIMTYTGVMLFIAPAGRVANWVNWEIFGMTKTEFGNVHTTFMVLFIVASILHVYYNWKPMTSYMKNKAKEMIVFTKDMVVATVISLIFFAGTMTLIPPFSTVVDFSEEISESWEKDFGSAPYSHAELSSLKNFLKKMKYDEVESLKLLESVGIKYKLSQSLSDLAKENGTSPKDIYQLLSKKFDKPGDKPKVLSGLGKKQIRDVAEAMEMKTEVLIEKLKKLGINTTPDEKFKQACENADKSPSEIVEALGFSH